MTPAKDKHRSKQTRAPGAIAFAVATFAIILAAALFPIEIEETADVPADPATDTFTTW